EDQPTPTTFPTRRSSDLQSARTYNVQPGTHVSSSSEITQTRPPIMNAQRVVGTDNLAKHEISGGLETINTQRVARNNDVQLMPRSEEHTSELQSRVDLVC